VWIRSSGGVYYGPTIVGFCSAKIALWDRAGFAFVAAVAVFNHPNNQAIDQCYTCSNEIHGGILHVGHSPNITWFGCCVVCQPQEPFLAVVVDPVRTMASGKVRNTQGRMQPKPLPE
jgi:hypothetical protein